MSSKKPITDTPQWFDKNVPQELREAAIEVDFERKMANNKTYKQADKATRQELRLAHRQLLEEAAQKSAHNPLNKQAIEDQQTTDESSFTGNLLRTGVRSVKETASRIPMVDDLVGRPDKAYAERLAVYLNKRAAAPITEASKQLAQDMKIWGENKQGGALNFIGASAVLAKDIITNPKGILDVAAESIGSMASMETGAKAGGAVAAAATAATGGGAAPAAPFIVGAGMFAAAATDAASAKMAEKMQEALDKYNLAYTPANIQMLIDKKPEIIQQIQTDSKVYGGVLGAVDVALGGFFSRLSSLPTRAARKAAMRSMDDVTRAMLASTANKLGVSVKDITEDFINHAAKQSLATRSFKQRLAGKALSYGGEVLSEPASEAAAMASIGDVKAEDLIYETIGGIGAGPIGASINTAAFGSKLAGNKTGAFIKDVATSTPESRAEVKSIKEATKKDIALADARNQHNFKKEVAEVERHDARITEWSDPTHKNYNPAKAVASLAKFKDDPEAVNQAEAVVAQSRKDILSLLDQAIALKEKQENGTIKHQEQKQLEALEKQLKVKQALYDQLKPQLQILRDKPATQAIDTETATTEQVISHAAETYGSSANSLSIEQLDTRLSREDLPDVERTLLQSMKDAAEARQTIEAARKPRTGNKTLEQVQEDIYTGTKDYKGIDSFKTAVANFLHPAVNKVESALKELADLKKFRDSRKEKLDVLSKAYKEMLQKDAETNTHNETKVTVAGTTNTIGSQSRRLIEAISNEAIALQFEVIAAENLIKAKQGLSTEQKQAPTASITALNIAPDTKEQGSAVPTAAPAVDAGTVTQTVESVDVSTKAKEKEVTSSPATKATLQERITAAIATVLSPAAKKHLPKEQEKTRQATQFIGEGAQGSTTENVRALYDQEGAANTGTYTENDMVFVASNGKRKGGVPPVVKGKLQGVYQNLAKAMAAGATIIMDTQAHLIASKKYNTGELALARYLAANGYQRVGQSGVWKKLPAQEKTQKKATKETLENLVKKGQATKKHGVYFIHKGAEWVTRHMAGVLSDNSIYVDMGVSSAFFEGADYPGKDFMWKALGITTEQFRSLFDSKAALNRFLYLHEKSHITNKDRENYPRKKDGSIDLESQAALDIEIRATLDALTAEQRSKLQEMQQQKQEQKQQKKEAKKESTLPDNADSMADADTTNTSIESLDPGAIEVTYTNLQGIEMTQTYNEAMIDLAKQLQDIQAIIKCVRHA